MLPTQEVIDDLADRIERTYSRRQPTWLWECSTRRVWSAAAVRLWQAHVEDPLVPLDGELYVASQPVSVTAADPWRELAGPEAARRYRSLVHRMVRRLRAELRREVSRAEDSIRLGREIGDLLSSGDDRFSPMARYIAAQRAGRADLAARLLVAATAQHRSCPLYRAASLSLIPADLYPAEGLSLASGILATSRARNMAALRN